MKHEAAELIRALLRHAPAIHADAGEHERGVVTFNPMCLRPGDAEIVARAVSTALG